VFPGFEITAATPGNIHLLCIFEPKTTSGEVSHVLTAVGLPPAKRVAVAKSTSAIGEVMKVVHGTAGIVIGVRALAVCSSRAACGIPTDSTFGSRRKHV
jgi:hypothetical protein